MDSKPVVNLQELIARGDFSAIENAVATDAGSIDRKDDFGHAPLYTAALYRNLPVRKFLIDHGAEVDLFACGYLGDASRAELLLAENPELARAVTSQGMTALHYAARAGHANVVRVLLQYEVDVNARDLNGKTALMEACHGGPWKWEPAEDVIQLLLDHGAKLDLFSVAATGRVALIETVLNENPKCIDDLNSQGETALFEAAHNNRLEAVKLLVQRGANLNKSDAVGTAALHRLSQQCSDELIQYLIDHGAQAHLCCYVACGDEAGTRKCLHQNPAAISEELYGFNAVAYAIHSWQLGTLKILLEHGCQLSEEDQGHILRISGNDHALLEALLTLQGERGA